MGRIAHVFRCVRAWLIWERIGTVAGPAAARAAQPITARAARLHSPLAEAGVLQAAGCFLSFPPTSDVAHSKPAIILALRWILTSPSPLGCAMYSYNNALYFFLDLS